MTALTVADAKRALSAGTTPDLIRQAIPDIRRRPTLRNQVMTFTRFKRAVGILMDDSDYNALRRLLPLYQHPFVMDDLRGRVSDRVEDHMKRHEIPALAQLYKAIKKYPLFLTEFQDTVQSMTQAASLHGPAFPALLHDFKDTPELAALVEDLHVQMALRDAMRDNEMSNIPPVIAALKEGYPVLLSNLPRILLRATRIGDIVPQGRYTALLDAVDTYAPLAGTVRNHFVREIAEELLASNAPEFPIRLEIVAKHRPLLNHPEIQKKLMQRISERSVDAGRLQKTLADIGKYPALVPVALAAFGAAFKTVPGLAECFALVATHPAAPDPLRQVCREIVQEPKSAEPL